MAEYSAFPSLDVQPPQTPNLLTMASQAMGVQGQMLQNTAQSNQNQMFAAKARANTILSQNLNSDGTVNMAGYTKAIANDPGAQMATAQSIADANTNNNTVSDTTGKNLTQHMTEANVVNTTLSGLLAQDPNGVTKQAAQDAIIDLVNKQILPASKAANYYVNLSDNPAENAKIVKSELAGLNQNISLLSPSVSYLQLGTQLMKVQTNPLANGGVQAPTTATEGMSPEAANAPVSYTNQNNQTVQTTGAGYAASHGGGVTNTGAPAGGAAAATSAPLTPIGNQAPAPIQVPQSSLQPRPANSNPASEAPGATAAPQPPTPAQIAAMRPQAQQSPAPASTQAPPPIATATPQGTPAGASLGPAPGTAEVQQMNIQDGTAAIHEGTDPHLIAQQSALEDAMSAAQSTSTGPAAQGLATLGALGNQFGFKIGNDDATNYTVFQKSVNQVVAAGFGYGANTDAKMAMVVGANPQAKMTPDAIQATGALALGQMQYQRNLGNAWQSAITSGTSPTTYHAWLQNYQSTAPSPFVLSLPHMPLSSVHAAVAWIKTQPPAFQRQINSQFAAMEQAQQPQQPQTGQNNVASNQ